MGNNSAPLSRLSWMASINNLPDITSDSLLASITRLPAFAAAKFGSKPAAPTIAAIT